MPQATLTSKGQITVPKPIRQHLKLKAGDRLVFLVGADGTVNIKPLTAPVTILKGMVSSGTPWDPNGVTQRIQP